MIVSVSRRCDIPRLQFKWFLGRLVMGYCEAVNPYNRHQVKRVPLIPMKEGMKPEDGVDIFVFWTRDPRNILANVESLTRRGFHFYVMVTVTDYPTVLEPSMVRASKVLTAMKKLSQIIDPKRVIWRYDPIFLSNITDVDFHKRNFKALAENLAGSVQRVIVSIYDEYEKIKPRMDALQKIGQFKLLPQEKITCELPGLLTDFANSAQAAGLEIQSCAEEDFSQYGVKPGACIDAELIKELCGLESGGKDKNQRPLCLCTKSTDIGAYKLCNSGCVYCYAWY